MIPASDLPVDSPRFRPKVIPLLVAAALGFGLPIAGAVSDVVEYLILFAWLGVSPAARS
jgi:hypothetical protein